LEITLWEKAVPSPRTTPIS